MTAPYMAMPGAAQSRRRGGAATTPQPGQPPAAPPQGSVAMALAPTFRALQQQGQARPASPAAAPAPPTVMYGQQGVPQPPGSQPGATGGATPSYPFTGDVPNVPIHVYEPGRASPYDAQARANRKALGLPEMPGTFAPGNQYTPYLTTPATPTDSAYPTAGGAGGDFRPEAEKALRELLANPTGFTDEMFQKNYNRLAGQIDDEYAINQQDVQTEMARRGLSDSTINAGRLNDLNIGKRSAKTELADRTLYEMGQALTQGKQNATGQAIGYGNTQNAQAMEGLQQLFELLGLENLYPTTG